MNPPSDIFRFPEEAFDVLHALEEAGYEAYFVGGCVRDSIMGRPMSDVDIATSARWQDTAAACEACGMRAHETGTKHGTVTIVAGGAEGAKDGKPTNANSAECLEGTEGADDGDCASIASSQKPPQAFEVTTYRVDSATSADSRHPDSVEFVSSIEEDLSRRDFTMNAMAWHPERGLVDPYGGRQDIAEGVIRVVGDPSRRFREDALRILRACRFASQLGFRIDGETYEAMLSHKSLLENVSTERVTHELDLLLLGGHVHDALMRTVDVLSFVVPELVAMKDCAQPTKYHCFDVLEHTAWAVQLAEPTRLVRWAALCHDMGKPACMFFGDGGVVHFYGHAAVSAKLARGMMDRLLMGPAFKDSLCAMVSNHSDKVAPTPKSVKRALAKVGGNPVLFRSLLALKRADILAHAPEYRGQAASMDDIEAVLDDMLAKGDAFAIRHLAIDGNDVMALGLAEGPEVGRVLQAVLDAVVDEAVENERDALIDYIITHMLCL